MLYGIPGERSHQEFVLVKKMISPTQPYGGRSAWSEQLTGFYDGFAWPEYDDGVAEASRLYRSGSTGEYYITLSVRACDKVCVCVCLRQLY